MDSEHPESWIAESVRLLRQNGSWTGRIHVHKHLFLAKALAGSRCPLDFSLYQYGPYSYELDSKIAEMELYGQLSKNFPSPVYGPQYSVPPAGLAYAQELSPQEKKILDRVAKRIGSSDSPTLELQATCIWVMLEEGVQAEDQVVDRVLALKPKYDRARIQQELSNAKQLQSALASD